MNRYWMNRYPVLLCSLLLLTGGCTRPPNDARHGGFDLRAERDGTVVVIKNERGEPVDGAVVHVAPGWNSFFFDNPLVTSEDGVARVSDFWSLGYPYEPCDEGFNIVVVRRGYRSVVLRRFAGHATLRLRASHPATVRVRLAEGTVLPKKPEHIEPLLEWIDDDEGWEDPRQLSPVGSSGREWTDVIEFEVDDPGTYGFGVMLWSGAKHRDLASGELRESVRPLKIYPQPLIIQVEPSDDVIEVEVRFDAVGR